MREQITLSELEEHLSFFSRMYDVVRLVDPIHKSVLECKAGQAISTTETCHAYWRPSGICDNCVSIYAHRENASRIKLEQKPGEIMLVKAIPVATDEGAVVLELFSSAADSALIQPVYDKGQNANDAIARANSMAIRDSLTSLYNRRFVYDRLPVDIVNAAIANKPLSVIYMEIENLKHINDAYGYVTGNLVLAKVAQGIQSCIRANRDWAARYGGVEFLICLGNTGSLQATRVMQRLRECIVSIDITIEGRRQEIDVALGVQTTECASLTAEEIIRLSMENMAQEKEKFTQTQS